MIDSKPFEKPVVVELGHVGKYRQISSTREAAECLMTVWPLNRGERHRDALDTCLKALEGYRSPADARRALIEAGQGIGSAGPRRQAARRKAALSNSRKTVIGFPSGIAWKQRDSAFRRFRETVKRASTVLNRRISWRS
ncbi:DUF982 domain-containing protein [Mesorhizobium sp.]|uniref:DUF982 domain-containing protein n=1 Tax=Mesorhizobium sp. TaxID=1871066 RepID=UPI0025BD13B5|nr:DUF982 domain-containing protein [Mesorhizobium sp.]